MNRSGSTASWVQVILLLAATAGALQAAEVIRRWAPISNDGVHDPRIPAVGLLQQPAEALSRLPAAGGGNQVDWVQALEKKLINPRTNILPGTAVRVLESDVLLNLRGSTPIVRFPHRAHTLWLDCTNCHDHLFKAVAGGNPLNMEKILQGEQCGVCHGAVAFPLTECNRCHSVRRDKPAARAP